MGSTAAVQDLSPGAALRFGGWPGALRGSSRGAGSSCVERTLVGFHGTVLSVFHFSLVFSLFTSLRFGLLSQRPLATQSWQEEGERERMSNCSRKVIKKNN